MKIAVVFATLGRPDIIGPAVRLMAQQTRTPDSILVSAVSPTDIQDFADDMPIEVLYGPKGLPAQRNTALRALPGDIDVVMFFDDDFAPHPTFLENLETLFASDATLVGATGNVVADGIGGRGYTFEQAADILAKQKVPPPTKADTSETYSLYGCNMAARTTACQGLEFDETLPLYGWQEDVDFTVQLGRKGHMVKSDALVGVHLGVKSARTPGKRMGYSQIANPIYLRTKNTIRRDHAYTLMLKNICANIVRSFSPEPWCDRRGRLAGNALAITDYLRGKLHPSRILDLES